MPFGVEDTPCGPHDCGVTVNVDEEVKPDDGRGNAKPLSKKTKKVITKKKKRVVEEPAVEELPPPVPEPESPLATVEKQPVEEAASLETPEVVVEPLSPYTEPPIAILIGPHATQHFVPRHLLPRQWPITEPDLSFRLPDITLETAHTLLHFLYTGTYQALGTCTPSTGLQRALHVYIALQSDDLHGLRRLAYQEMEKHAAALEFFEVLDAVKADFARVHSESWVYGFLREKVAAAFDTDHSVFRDEAFLATLDNVALGKVVMKWVVEMFDAKVARMIEVERAVEADKKIWIDKYEEVCQKLYEEEVVGEELVAPVVDEHCGKESDGFCTISCPSEEDGVVVQEADLSMSVERVGNEREEEEKDAEAARREMTAPTIEPEPAGIEEELAVDPLAGLNRLTILRLQKQMRMEARRKEREGAVEPLQQEDEAEIEAKIARLREQEEAAFALECEQAEEAMLRQEEEAAAAVEPEPAAVEEEPAIDPFAGLASSQKKKLQIKMKREARRKEEEQEMIRREEAEAAEAENIRQEEERLRKGAEAAANAAAAAFAADMAAEPKVCPLRARHMIKEKRWMKCSSCRADMQHMAIRLSRTSLDEETLQDLEKELIF